jgi:hypothetical protein
METSYPDQGLSLLSYIFQKGANGCLEADQSHFVLHFIQISIDAIQLATGI